MIKDLDEAIQHCLEVADQKEEDAVWWDKAYQDGYASQEAKECKECAEEHRQLAEWLKELKMWREGKLTTDDWED